MKDEREELQDEIEAARKVLNAAMVDFDHREKYYSLSLTLDALIEKYIDLQERENRRNKSE